MADKSHPAMRMKFGNVGKAKVKKVFHEGKVGELHSGSKSGPVVPHGSKQEVAIALSEARKAERGGYKK